MTGSIQEQLALGEEIAKCPSCSLIIRVIYDPVRVAYKHKRESVCFLSVACGAHVADCFFCFYACVITQEDFKGILDDDSEQQKELELEPETVVVE